MQYYISFPLLILALWVLRTVSEHTKTRAFELVKPGWRVANPVSDAVSRGYRQISMVTGKPFFVRYWRRDYLVLPTKYLPDVRRAARDRLEFLDSIADVFFQYNWLGDLYKSSRMVFAVMKGVNPQLPRLAEAMFEESKRAFVLEVGDIGQDELKTLPALEFFTAISLRTMTRIIGGKELARDEKFLKAFLSYMNGNFMIGFILLNLPFSRTINDLLAWPLIKYHKRFRQRNVLNMIKPFVTTRMEEHRLGAHEKREFDTIQATLNLLHEFPFDPNARDSPAHTLAHETLQLVWAGGQSPAISAGSIVFKMLEKPSYIAPLREEAQAAVDRHGWADAIFNELPKLDSFIRETHRLFPLFSLNATRVVKGGPFTFSDGLTLPAGTRIAFPAADCQRDPEIIADPDEFDGFRFVRLAATSARQEDGVNRWAASHSSYSNLTFGYGNHACPGRFIAIRLLKLIMVRLLLGYDLSWDHGGEEPPKMNLEGMALPNVTAKITLRRRNRAAETKS